MSRTGPMAQANRMDGYARQAGSDIQHVKLTGPQSRRIRHKFRHALANPPADPVAVVREEASPRRWGVDDLSRPSARVEMHESLLGTTLRERTQRDRKISGVPVQRKRQRAMKLLRGMRRKGKNG